MSEKPYYLAKLTSKNQVVIPKEVREILNLKPGDYIAFIVEDNTVRVKKAEIKV